MLQPLQTFEYPKAYPVFCTNSVKIMQFKNCNAVKSHLFKHFSTVVLTDQRHVEKKLSAVAANRALLSAENKPK